MVRINSCQIILCIIALFLAAGELFAEQQITKAIYDLPLEHPVLKNKSPGQTAEYLRDSGINAVVRVPLDNSIIDQLHKNGIKAYAELVVFLGKDYWQERPESRPILSNGKPAGLDGWYAGLCPTQKWLINQKVKEAEEIAKKYQIDGLWLDFIRWPTRWDRKEPKIQLTCFCESCLERFQKETGIKIPGELKSTGEISEWIYKNHSKDWYEFRCNVIVDAIRKVKGAIKKYRKDAIIGIFTVPWKEEDFDNAIYKVIGQDIEKLSGIVDVFSPMTYHLICGRNTAWITSVVQWTKSKTDTEVWPIVQSINEPVELSAEEYERALRSGLRGGSTGVITFATGATLENGKWEVQKKVFTQINKN
ncbi:MAG: putative glycoside hydrolase [Candidatus Omnitrophota bacterium]